MTVNSGEIDVKVDQDVCVSVRMCMAVASEHFVEAPDGSTVFRAVSGISAELAIEAAEACPSGAITVQSRSTGEVIFP